MNKIKKVFLDQLKQGVTPKSLAAGCAVGVFLGSVPMLGTTTFLCFLACLIFRLNQPIVQIINYLMYPAQILLIPVFLYAGAWMYNVEPVSINPQKIIEEFFLDIPEFFRRYGFATLQALTAWLVIASMVAVIVYFIVHQILKRVLKKGGANV